MAYFGGMGAGKGWHKFLVVVTPDELGEVLAQTPCVLVHANPVPNDYEQTPLTDYISSYANLFAQFGEIEQAHHTIDSAVRIAASTSLDAFTSCPSKLPGIKVINAEQVVVSFAPGTLLFDGTMRLCLMSRDATTFGLELTFPKVVFLDSENMEKRHADNEFPDFELFQRLTSNLKKRTRPCRMESPVRAHKLRARISDAAKAELRDRRYFRQHALQFL